ncbi:IS110 family transposase [Nocardioides sp. NPDC047086]|uniref:IS110 family transposase n=1 Tax=Nocardioides sp. NPDC047086 TaxID=3154810 RepID=UPI0033F52C28
MDRPDYAVYLGLDVGKEEHHATGLDPSGTRVHDKTLPQAEDKIRDLLQDLSARGRVLVVVDQPASIGALAVAVARDLGIDVAYLPGLAMRRIADLHPGNAKTDARDAYIIAEAARSMPHALRRVDTGDEALADLEVIVGYDDDLAGEVTRISNRIRGLLTQINPGLERVLGPKIQCPAVLELLIRFGGPTGLAAATRRQLIAATKTRAPRSYEQLVDDVQQALTEQSVTVPGTRAAEMVLPQLATQLAGLLAQRATAAAQIEEMLDAHPLAKVLTSMPGIGVRTGARILLEVGDGTSFPTSGHLAAYAGLAPVTRRSGTSIRGEHPSRAGNKQLKRAFFLAAFAALHDPTSRAYYDRKRAQGKKHNAALVCLARRRIDVLHAMLKHGTLYEDRSAPAAA